MTTAATYNNTYVTTNSVNISGNYVVSSASLDGNYVYYDWNGPSLSSSSIINDWGITPNDTPENRPYVKKNLVDLVKYRNLTNYKAYKWKTIKSKHPKLYQILKYIGTKSYTNNVYITKDEVIEYIEANLDYREAMLVKISLKRLLFGSIERKEKPHEK